MLYKLSYRTGLHSREASILLSGLIMYSYIHNNGLYVNLTLGHNVLYHIVGPTYLLQYRSISLISLPILRFLDYTASSLDRTFGFQPAKHASSTLTQTVHSGSENYAFDSTSSGRPMCWNKCFRMWNGNMEFGRQQTVNNTVDDQKSSQRFVNDKEEVEIIW